MPTKGGLGSRYAPATVGSGLLAGDKTRTAGELKGREVLCFMFASGKGDLAKGIVQLCY